MKLTTAIASALLLAGSVTAAPFTERRRAANAERLARRLASGAIKAIGPLSVNATSSEDTIMIGPKTEGTEANSQSSNWSVSVPCMRADLCHHQNLTVHRRAQSRSAAA
jgi:hypothetical protein